MDRLRLYGSEVDAFSDRESILEFDPEVPDCAVHFCVPRK
jgi:hypothetical protein